MTTETKLVTSLTEEQLRVIGESTERNHMTADPIGAMGLRDAGVDFKHMLTPDDQNLILWHAGCLGNLRVAEQLFGADDPTEEIPAEKFTRKLHHPVPALILDWDALRALHARGNTLTDVCHPPPL